MKPKKPPEGKLWRTPMSEEGVEKAIGGKTTSKE